MEFKDELSGHKTMFIIAEYVLVSSMDVSHFHFNSCILKFKIDHITDCLV